MQFSDITVIAIGAVVVLSIAFGLIQVSKTKVVRRVDSRGKEDHDPQSPIDSVFTHLKESTEAELNYDFKRSLECLENALALAPDNPTVLYKMGKVLQQLGDNNKAKDYFQKVLNISPNDIKPTLELSRILTKEGNLDEAEVYAEKAMAISPDNESALKMKALVCTKKNDPAGAFEVFGKLMNQFPQNLTYQRQYGLSLKRQRKWDDVISFYEGLITTCPDNAVEYRLELAYAYMEMRNFDAAVDAYRKIVEVEGEDILTTKEGLKENFAAGLCNLGAQWQNQHELQQAEACYQEALRYDENNPDVLFNYGKILADTEQFPRAKEQFTKAIEINPNDADSLYELGRVYDKTNELEPAKEHYERCLAANPRYGKAAYGLGTVYGVMGELEQSMAYLKMAIKLEPGNVDALYNLGVCHERMDEKNKAVQLYRKVLEVDNRHEDAKNNLANLKVELGIS